ncbi:Kunitz/Bovine pancreatic trypsin inhibitor domain protein [Ancylostoma caninum]|uniref:Kunitz/Bovine pancreatic trypsin inhibitor domain protein n=1 Tax=Ancylostoma caninum TaxID=29170 RepID=A0A368GWY7_ANCCA|nr:Kunitz/Bovine pancreatic trypsin inhibitor domain protein [Ancylostoma caninum]
MMLKSNIAVAEASWDPRCRQPIDEGTECDNPKETRYAHKDGKCVTFTYAGCGGNENNFGNENACKIVCSV